MLLRISNIVKRLGAWPPYIYAALLLFTLDNYKSTDPIVAVNLAKLNLYYMLGLEVLIIFFVYPIGSRNKYLSFSGAIIILQCIYVLGFYLQDSSKSFRDYSIYIRMASLLPAPLLMVLYYWMLKRNRS